MHEWACRNCGLQLSEAPDEDEPDVECPNCGEDDWYVSKDLPEE